MPRSGGSASAFCRAASAASGSAMTVRPAAPARPRFSSLRRPIFSSSSRRRNSYSCSWKSSTASPSGRVPSGDRTPIGGGRAIGSRPWIRRGEPRVSGCAPRSTRIRRTRTGSCRPRGVAQHYGRAGYDVVALTDHWHRSEAPSTAGLLVLPGVELNCLLPGGPRRTRARDRDRAGSGGARGRAARPRGDCGVDRRSGRRGVPRASLLDRRPARRLRAAGVRRRNRGLQRGLRARGRARPVVRPLGRAAPGRPLVSRARDRRQPPSGLRLRPRVDLAARGADGGKRARPRCGRAGSTAAPAR